MSDPDRKKEKLWTSANIVTLIRICGVPLFVVAILSPWPTWFGLPAAEEWKDWVAAGIFIILAATDGLDGYLARSRNEVTNFGKFMDPLADKILVAAALLALIELNVLPSWVALIILCREFIVSGIRMVAASQGVVIAASWYGKAKTVTQIIAILLFIIKNTHMVSSLSEVLSDWFYLISWGVMLVALALTIISMLDYFSKARYLLGFKPSAKKDKSANGPTASESSVESMDLLEDEKLASEVLSLAQRKGMVLGTAESCTGGLVAGMLTSVPGSSEVVQGAIVSYSNDIKKMRLSVNPDTLDSFGAVSKETACEMALGALDALDADIAVSITGIAGPGGATPGKPVGTVWIGVAYGGKSDAKLYNFQGSRDAIRTKSVHEALLRLKGALEL